jgi:hypothetical protein
VIYGIELLKRIGKNLPFIVLGFAGLNTILAITSYFSIQYPFVIFNAICAGGGFSFFIQLHKRRNIHSLSIKIDSP